MGKREKKEEKREDGLPFFFLLNLTVTGLNACVTSLSSDAGMKKSRKIATSVQRNKAFRPLLV